MYNKMDYVNYRRVIEYYSGSGNTAEEDAWDLRKALPRDIMKESIKPLKNPNIRPEDLEWS
jgi:N-terminal acetyltransferase B complex catalytic subunit